MDNKLKILVLDDQLNEETDIFNFSLRGWQFPFKMYLERGWKYVDINELKTNIDTLDNFFTSKYGKIPDVLFFNEFLLMMKV